ncbi:hypothetical protein O181_071814 [Austropuccinia psidii MF-1]|uniref:Uncharacterized protein n=1 Tax=Austropuccinia psidii MF-1 TaxID=1389203 RepID=A0A9Q3F3Y7_9BASI|nr:hypothetical protein [Austropuccinia psidii MF-1]
MESICKRVPKELLINFYDAVWFNDQTAGEKTIFSNTFSVEFLLDVSRSLWGRQHPDKQLSDWKFSQKYWDKVVVPYNLSHKIEVGDNDESSAGSISEVKSDEEDIEISEEDMDDINSGKELEEDPRFFIDRDTEMNNTDGPSNLASVSKDIGFSNEWAG